MVRGDIPGSAVAQPAPPGGRRFWVAAHPSKLRAQMGAVPRQRPGISPCIPQRELTQVLAEEERCAGRVNNRDLTDW